jgi:uncharacterized membrane protein YphA (DoxX/SURF4 family)
MVWEDIGSALIRISLGWFFLAGAWTCGKSAEARTFTRGETALVFSSHTEFFALAGIFIMGAGGLSILLGVFPRLGALGLTIFLVPAAMIHLRRRDLAVEVRDKALNGGVASGDGAMRNALQDLGFSAEIGHQVAALKNFALLGPTLYLTLAGARPPMLIGFDPDWNLVGILVAS